MINKLKNFAEKRWKLLLILTILIIVVLFFIFKNNKKTVDTGTVQKGNISQDLILSGQVLAKNYAKLSFETSGKVSYVGVSEGDKVTKGGLISKLDTTVLNSNYQIALANLRAAEATADNIHDQVKNHSSDETFAQRDLRTGAETAKDKAYEAVIAAKKNLDGGSLYAPFSGVVASITHPFSGVYAQLGVTEVELIDPQTIYFEVLADQNEVGSINEKQKVKIVLDSFDDKTYEGIVEYISFAPKAGEVSTSYQIKVEFNDRGVAQSNFKIGMTGDAKFALEEKSDIFFVPSNFINSDKDGKYLKIDGKGKKQYIETGLESEENTEVVGDVYSGQVIYD